MSKSLRITTIANVGYNSVAKICALVFGAVANIILTRALSAADYGIVGFATILVTFLGQFSDLGISNALIHRRELDDTALYTGFTVKFCLGSFISLLAWVVAPYSIALFDDHAVVSAIKILSLIFFINTFSMLPTVLLTRQLDYKMLSLSNTLTALFQSAVAVTLALQGYNYNSIVYANLSASLFSVLVINLLKPARPGFRFDRKIADQLTNYGGNLFLTGFLVFLIFNFDNFAIGALAGSEQLGFYSLAFSWGSFISVLMSSTVITVLFPTFTKMDGDHGRIKTAYLKVLEAVSFAGVLANTTLFAISEDFLILVVGDGSHKWLPALAAFRVLCVYGIIRLLLEPVGSVLMAIGRTEQLRKANLIVAALELVFLFPVLRLCGINGVAVLVTVAYSSQYLVYFPFLKREMGLTFLDMARKVSPALCSILPAAVVAIAAGEMTHASISRMLIKSLLCISTFVLAHGTITKWRLLRETGNAVRLAISAS